jgi:hypothetical protein
MDWSAKSSEDTRDVLSRAISAQMARAREVLDVGTNPASPVHEARRAIKRARALLRMGLPVANELAHRRHLTQCESGPCGAPRRGRAGPDRRRHPLGL